MNQTYNPYQLANELIAKMGFANEKSERVNILKQLFEKQITHIIVQTLAETLEPETIDELLTENPNETDLVVAAVKLLETNPQSQMAILDELERFEAEMLNDYQAIAA